MIFWPIAIKTLQYKSRYKVVIKFQKIGIKLQKKKLWKFCQTSLKISRELWVNENIFFPVCVCHNNNIIIVYYAHLE